MTPIDPIKALFWSAVINGVLSIPIMVLMILMDNNKEIVGDLQISPVMKFTGWSCTLAMIIAVGMMGCTLI